MAALTWKNIDFIVHSIREIIEVAWNLQLLVHKDCTDQHILKKSVLLRNLTENLLHDINIMIDKQRKNENNDD